MKLIFTWQCCDPRQIAFGLDAEHFAYEAEIPEHFIPEPVLMAVEQGFKPRVLLVNQDRRNEK